MEFQDLLDYCQSQAIASHVSPDELSIWRSICRTYSKMFHTPLIEVEKLSPKHVVLNVYEEQMEDLDTEKYENLEKLMDTIQNIIDPNYQKDQEDKLSQDIAKYEREEEERVKAGRAVHPALKKKTLPEIEQPEIKKRPTGGSVDLSHLEKEDSES